MYWRLTDSVTACIAAGRVIFLDVARDRYFALPEALNASVASWLSGSPAGALPTVLRPALVQLAIVASGQMDQLSLIPCIVEMPATLDSERLAPVPIRLRTILAIGAAAVSAWHDVRSRPLAGVLERRASSLRDAGPADGEKRRARLAAFRAVRPLVPVKRVCLHDCLALLKWLGPSGAGAQLVFGVSAFPFAAHCWVQADGRVIDDHPESVSRFEPILHLG